MCVAIKYRHKDVVWFGDSIVRAQGHSRSRPRGDSGIYASMRATNPLRDHADAGLPRHIASTLGYSGKQPGNEAKWPIDRIGLGLSGAL